MQSQDSPASTVSVTATATATSATEQKLNLPDTTDAVTEMTDNKEPATTIDATQNQQLHDATVATTEMVVNRKAHTHVLTPAEDLFNSLFATEKTPPTTPGSVASSGTLIDPSSRKVSPLDLGTLGKDSPNAVKDFAYPSPDSIRVDPVAVIEEETKKGLLKQLKKKVAAEEKASRKSEKLAARTKTLSAELKSAKAAVENRDAQADIAKIHANAMTVSNVVLRQLMEDVSRGLSRENNGTQANGTASEGEAKWDQQKEEFLQGHLRGVDESSASAYGRMQILENASAVRGQDLDDTFGLKSVPQENPLPTNEVVESKESKSSAAQPPSQQASEGAQTDVVVSTSFTGTSEDTQPETTAEASEVPPKEKVGDFFEKYGFDPAEIARTVSSVNPSGNQASEEKDTKEVTPEEEAFQEIEDSEVDPMAEEAILTPLQEYQQQNLNLGEESATGRSQVMADPIAADFDDATPDQEDPTESDGEDQACEADEDTSPSTAESLGLESACDEEEPVTEEPVTDAARNDVQAQAVTESHEASIQQQYEFSEPAGPATLWGILQSDRTENDATEIASAQENAANAVIAGLARIRSIIQSGQSESNANDVAGTDDDAATVSERPGPTTLWGKLQSSQSENEARDDSSTSPAERPTPGSGHAEDPVTQEPITDATRDHDHVQAENEGHEDDIHGNYEFPEPAGPATLWGILQSSHDENGAKDIADVGEDTVDDVTAGVSEAAGPTTQPSLSEHEANDNAHVVEEAADSPDAEGPASLWEILHEVGGQEVAGDEAAGASDEEPPGPATLWGILRSDHDTPVDHSRDIELSDNGRMDGDVVPGQSEDNDVAGAQDEEDKEPCDLPYDTPLPDSSENTNGLHDTNDNEKEPPKKVTETPTDDEHPSSSSHGSVDDDVIAVEEIDTQEVIAEEAVGAIGAECPPGTLETVSNPIGGSKTVEVSECELDNGATEAVDVHETTISVHANTPVGAAEDRNEYAGDATAARMADQEESAAEEANACEVPATPEELKDSDVGDIQVVEEIAVTGTSPLPTATAEEEGVSGKGAILDRTTVIGNMQATCCEDTDDHNMAIGSSGTTAEGSNAVSPVPLAQTLSLPSTSSTTPRAISPYHVEQFDFFGPVPQPKEVTKTEKRRQERKRAAAKREEEKKLRLRMEEEAKNTPEAIAQREAEELKSLGEKRLRLQQARMDAVAKAEEQARLARLAGR